MLPFFLPGNAGLLHGFPNLLLFPVERPGMATRVTLLLPGAMRTGSPILQDIETAEKETGKTGGDFL